MPEVSSEDMYLRPALSTCAMMVDSATFGANLYLIIGGLIALIVVGLAILLTIVVVRHVDWCIVRDRAEAAARRAKYRRDGQPHPPVDRGLCDVCSRVRRKVHYLESGQRLCEDCYKELGES